MTQRSAVWTRVGVVLASAGLCTTVVTVTAERRLDREPLSVHADTAVPQAESTARQPDSGAPEVSLARGKAVRGETVYLPLVVFQDEVKVVKTISEISFPNATVSFEGFERIGDQDPLLRIDAALVPESKGREQGVVKVEVASGRNQPLPEGALVKLKFKVSPEMPGGVLRLKHTADAVAVGGKTITAVAMDANVEVSEIAVYSCFYYMH